MSLWFERFIFPICVAIVAGVLITNPFKLDWNQRIAAAVCITALAYFIGHTVQKPKAPTADAIAGAAPVPDPRIGVLQDQVNDLKQQQKKLLDQQAASEKEKKRKQQMRQQLGIYVEQGQDFMARCGNEQVPAPVVEAEKWAQSVEAYLKKELGPEYVPRFRSGAGMPLAATSLQDKAHRDLWGGINVRVYRLQEFMSELRD